MKQLKLRHFIENKRDNPFIYCFNYFFTVNIAHWLKQFKVKNIHDILMLLNVLFDNQYIPVQMKSHQNKKQNYAAEILFENCDQIFLQFFFLYCRHHNTIKSFFPSWIFIQNKLWWWFLLTKIMNIELILFWSVSLVKDNEISTEKHQFFSIVYH